MLEKENPIIIGGAGGSGTRVVAEILSHLGFFMGNDLNRSNDNLLFTFFFKHPQFYADNKHKYQRMLGGLLRIHEKLFFGQRPNIYEVIKIVKWGFIHAVVNKWYSWRWVLKRIKKIYSTTIIKSNKWGWKEPHTVFFLNEIKNYYPAAKYILVIRNGLDMVYSDTDQQFRYWSNYYDIDSNDTDVRNKFEFWYRLNLNTVEEGKKLFGENFFLLRFEPLCLDSKSTIKKIMDWLEIDNDKIREELFRLPELPKSFNRYKNHNQDWIDNDVLSKLSEFGYHTEEAR